MASTLLTMCVLAGVGRPSTVRAQSAENVLVVINAQSAASTQIGEYYARKRGVPETQVVRIRTAEDETITRAAFEATIQAPIASAIATQSLQDRILYLVLTKGVPLRIQGTAGLDGTAASVDSELTLLYRRMAGLEPFVRGSIANPYFLGEADIREAKPFTHRDQSIYLVTRLDGYTVSEVIALVDRAAAPIAQGRIVLDQRAAPASRVPDDWLAETATRLTIQGHGDRVLLESTPKPASDVASVLGYFSWGPVNAQNPMRSLRLQFVNGAIAGTFAGADARTLREPRAAPGAAGDLGDAVPLAGSPPSVVGDLIREGVTGVAGAVGDPYVQGLIRPEILFSAYVAGFNLAEAFYLAMPQLGWQTIVVGDPLCAPFPRKAAAAGDLNPEIEPNTELPRFFGALRAEATGSRVRTNSEAVGHLVRAEARLARNLVNEARAAFEQALAADDRLVVAHMRLAQIDEGENLIDAAIARYQRVIELEPRNAAALNNLAYAIAVHKARPADAKPLSQRAVAAAPGDPLVLDTLGWIEHLLGNHKVAARLLATAARNAPGNPDVRLHTAFAAAAAGAAAAAAAELKVALALDPRLGERQDVRDLKARLDFAIKDK